MRLRAGNRPSPAPPGFDELRPLDPARRALLTIDGRRFAFEVLTDIEQRFYARFRAAKIGREDDGEINREKPAEKRVHVRDRFEVLDVAHVNGGVVIAIEEEVPTFDVVVVRLNPVSEIVVATQEAQPAGGQKIRVGKTESRRGVT